MLCLWREEAKLREFIESIDSAPGAGFILFYEVINIENKKCL